MGVFCDYLGDMNIPDELKDEFNKNMITLLQRGGMMKFEKVSLFGKELSLLKPLEEDEEGKIHFFYNYFEDDAWESAIYYPKNQVLYSGKIGSDEFNRVICSAYIIYELYAPDHGMVDLNGNIVDPVPYIAWINHVLHSNFNARNRMDWWHCYESYCFHQLEDDSYDKESCMNIVLSILPKDKVTIFGITPSEYWDIYFSTMGTGDLKEHKIEPGSYYEEILKAKQEVDRLFEGGNPSGKEKLYNLLKLPYEKRKAIEDENLKAVAEMSLRLPARVFVYLAAEILDIDFMTEWYSIHGQFYTDAVVCDYLSEERIKERDTARKTKIEEMKTSDFLRMDQSYKLGDPEELKDKPNYYISDDDLIYWWDGSDDVVLSDQMIKIIAKWSEELKDIEAELTDDSIADYDMLKALIDLLSQANSSYKRIFAFRTMFYEFIENNKNIHYIAAVKLLEKILDDNWETGKIIERVGRWEFASKNVTFNEGRVTVKRYLSLLANKKLRKQYLGF